MNNNYILLGIISFIIYLYLFQNVLSEGMEMKSFNKKSKDKLCRKDLIINKKQDCVSAIKNLNLDASNWWEGIDENIPPGCSWADKLGGAGMAFWNKSSVGKHRHDINPICYKQEMGTYMSFLKKINKNLMESFSDNTPVPIALNMRVGKESDMIKEGMLTGNKLFEQGIRLKSSPKLNSDLNNFYEYEGFKNRDKFKLIATNSLLMDLAHLRENQPKGTPIELNLMI